MLPTRDKALNQHYRRLIGGTYDCITLAEMMGSSTSRTKEISVEDEGNVYCNRVRTCMSELRRRNVTDADTREYLEFIYMIYFEFSSKKEVRVAVCEVLIAEGILTLFAKSWNQCHDNPNNFYGDVKSAAFENLKLLKSILQNYAHECKEMASAYFENGDAIELIMREFSFPQLDVSKISAHQGLGEMIEANFAILINSVKNDSQIRNHIRKNNGVEKVLAYSKSKLMIIKAKVFIIVAYCINDDENSKLLAGYGIISFIIKMLETAASSSQHSDLSTGFIAEELVEALTKLASNDENKKSMVEAGVLPILTKLLKDSLSSASEHLTCINCLWSLAFHKDNKDKIIKEPGLIDSVKTLRKTDDDTKKAYESLMFVLGLDGNGNPLTGAQNKHIMLSYNWGVKEVILQLKEYLSSQNCNVWMDVDNIHGSILSAMADAVENSALVVVAMTESYKDSLACRTEAEYAFQRKVPILPLLLQPGYRADGWLGALVGTKLFVDLSSVDFRKRFPDVLTEVRSLTSAPLAKDTKAVKQVSTFPLENLSLEPAQSSVTSVGGSGVVLARTVLPCETWSVGEVQGWCSKIGIKELQKYDGRALCQLCKLLVRSPDEYYRLLREDLHLDSMDKHTLTDALESFIR